MTTNKILPKRINNAAKQAPAAARSADYKLAKKGCCGRYGGVRVNLLAAPSPHS